jgi:LPS export ABC transporter protein LptC
MSLLFLLFSSCETDIQKINLVSNKQSLAAESAKNIEVIYSDSAKIRIIIKAPMSEHFINQNPYLEMAKGIDVVFYKSNMEVQNKLTANYAIKYEQKHLMEAKGNVIVINEKGDQLKTEHLFWDEVTQMIYSKEFVTITTADEILYGDGFEANQNFTKYKITKPKGLISLNKNKP